MVRRAKATKRGGMGGEDSERLILPAEAGESSHETPWREGGGREMDPLAGKTANTPRLEPVSTLRQRIAERARHAPWVTSSHPGPTGTRGGSEAIFEEPDAAEPARPDLWGARVSNDPGHPTLQKYGVYYGIGSQPAYRSQKQPVCYILTPSLLSRGS